MKRWILWGSLVVVMVAVGIGAAAYLNGRQELGSAPDRSGIDWGAAGTLLGGTSGFEVRVTRMQRDEAIGGSRYTVLDVVFTNTSSSQQRADPSDFTLLEGAGRTRQPVFVGLSQCARWPLTDLYPKSDADQPLRDAGGNAVGPTFGPVTLCFPSEPATSSLMLVWDPDVSMPFLDSPTRIALR